MMGNPMMQQGKGMNPMMAQKAMMPGPNPMTGMMPGPMGMPGMMPGKGMSQMPMAGKGMPQQPMPQQQQPQQAGGAPAGAPLNAATLAAAPPSVQKQMIGEKLFPAISKFQPELAGKITGMMLEMDNSELLI